MAMAQCFTSYGELLSLRASLQKKNLKHIIYPGRTWKTPPPANRVVEKWPVPEEPKESPQCTERSGEIQPKKKCANGDIPVLEVGKKPPRSTPAPIVQAADTRHVQRSTVCGPSNRTMNDAVHGKQKLTCFTKTVHDLFFPRTFLTAAVRGGGTHGQQPAQ